MIVALVSEQCQFTAQQEIDAITRYRKLDRDGHIVNCRGDSRCMNRSPGGESFGHGVAPQFLYCVFGPRHLYGENGKRPRDC